jgi:Gram-negative bacterial TonB protein C-terminal
MFLPRQLLVSTLIILLLSCNSTDKQKEQVNSPGLTKDTIAPVPKREELKPGTTTIIEKKPVTFKIKRAKKVAIANSDLQVQTSLENDFKTIGQNFQDFVINTNFDTTILCKEGTGIKIKHSSFLIASNLTEAKGTIIFQVKEFYRTSDIILARLTTHSNNNILETGGMLFIQAIADGQLCKLKDNSAIEIPCSEKKDGMLLFSGSWTNQKIDWQLFSQNQASQKGILEEIAAFPGGTAALNRFILRNLVYPDSLSDMGIGGMVQMDFVIDETGKATDVNFKNRSQQGFKDAILNTFSKMPRWKSAKRNGVSIRSTYSQSIIFYNEEQNISDTIFKNDFEAKINDTNINKVKTADIRQYVFSTSKLGWINCDRFYNSPKPMTDFYVDCGNYTELDIKLVFHSFKAILDNYASKSTSKFENIPNDEVVTVVVVKKLNNETLISLTESNTNLKSINNLAFEKVTMGKLKQKLEQLNNAR